MVESIYINKIIRKLEKYLIRKSGYSLRGENYALIILLPSDKFSYEGRYSLLISSETLDHINQKVIIKELLTEFKQSLLFEEYNSISRLNIINSGDPMVKNLSLIFPYREKIITLNNMEIGGVQIDFAYILKSLILDKLIFNQAVVFELMDGQKMKAGIKRIDSNFDIIHYTQKGLEEIWPQVPNISQETIEYLRAQEEEYLFENKYLAKTSIDIIERIV
jgi:hypothetical protein